MALSSAKLSLQAGGAALYSVICNSDQIELLFKELCNATCLKLLFELVSGEKDSLQLMAVLHVDQSHINELARRLRRLGLINRRRRGQNVYSSLNPTRVNVTDDTMSIRFAGNTVSIKQTGVRR